MLTVDQVRDANLAGLRAAATEWADQARRIGEYASRYRGEVLDAVNRSGWTGPASDAARPNLAADLRELEAARTEAAAVARALATAAGEFGAAQRELAHGLDEAARLGVKVSSDGGVSWPPELRNDPDVKSGPLAQRASAVHRLIGDALRKADRADEEAARDLREDVGIRPDAFNGSATEGRRKDPDRILAEYQVKDDPNGTTPYPNPLMAWMFEVKQREITKTEAVMLDQLSPFEQSDFKDIRDKAFHTSGGWTGGAEDGHRDAFRHAYWNALMTRRYGEKWTERYASAHEQLPDNPADKEAMDLHNNEVGRRIAREHPNASEEELVQLVSDAVRRGETVVIRQDGGSLAYSDQVEEGRTGSSDGVVAGGPARDPGGLPATGY